MDNSEFVRKCIMDKVVSAAALKASLWVQFACECLRRGDSEHSSSRNADIMVREFFARFDVA